MLTRPALHAAPTADLGPALTSYTRVLPAFDGIVDWCPPQATYAANAAKAERQ
ncbi:hypothetical protein [Streptomyces apocyni]|uniref:hypothetical protein n=1 Tax=Streptomyces apocyni TaxID=2654677 RepID=UPI0012EACC10|nr:hypothetical protein [Streptomyces apocyni]